MPTPDDETIADAYIYLLRRMLVIRQERSDFKLPGAAYNVIKYNPLGSADFVNPNFDVAYLEAWIAADERAPALLKVPEIMGRYYTAQILDEWGEVIANINERTFPSKPFGSFALVAPGSTAPIPPDAGRVELHSRKAKMLARVELKDDSRRAVELQKQFALASLGTPTIAPPPAIPDFDNKELVGAEIFDDVDARLSSALDVSPIAAPMQQKVRAVAAYVASGSAARGAVDKRLRNRVIPNAPMKLFWSVTLYDVATRSLLVNRQKIADRSSRMDLKKNADASVDIYCGPKAPKGFEENWIPTVPGKAWFSYFRLYEPTPPYFDRSWPLGDFESVK
jgi:hypothetical protein